MAQFGCHQDTRPCSDSVAAVEKVSAGHVHCSNFGDHGEEADSLGQNGRIPLKDPRWAEESVRVKAPEDNSGEVVELFGGGAQS